MGPIWGRQDPGGPHELCYLGWRHIVGFKASQFISISTICPIAGTGPHLKKIKALHWSAFVMEIYRWTVDSPHKGPITGKAFYIYVHTISRVMKSAQNGRDVADNIFKCIFLKDNVFILFWNPIKLVPEVPIDSKWVLVQIMAWRRAKDEPLFEPLMA